MRYEFVYLCYFITRDREKQYRVEHIDREQSRRRAVVKSFRQISPFADRPDFVSSHCVRASSAKSGIYSSQWNFRGWRILRLIPGARATAKLVTFFASRERAQNEKIPWISPTCCSKISDDTAAVRFFYRKKPHALAVIFHCGAVYDFTRERRTGCTKKSIRVIRWIVWIVAFLLYLQINERIFFKPLLGK